MCGLHKRRNPLEQIVKQKEDSTLERYSNFSGVLQMVGRSVKFSQNLSFELRASLAQRRRIRSLRMKKKLKLV